MFTRRYTLFRLFGFEVRLDLTWLVLAVLVTWSLASGLFPAITPGLDSRTYFWMGVIGTLGLLFSIVFHELSHSLVARRYGLPIGGITLFIFGGVAEMTQEPPNAKTEFLMAVAGPISSFVLALLFYELYLFTASDVATPLNGIAYYLGLLNVILAVFNLVPAFPLDGGRMLRAALWGWKGDYRWATRIAARMGSGFGLVLIMLGVFAFLTGNIITGMWWFLIGLFLRGAAGMSYQQLMIRETMHGEKVARFMNPNPVTVSPNVRIQDLVDDYIYHHHFKMYPVVDNERLLGCVSTDQVKAVPREEWHRRAVADVMDRCTPDNTVSPNADAMEAWMQMSRTGSSRLLVEERGRLIGILSLRDLMRFMSLKFDLDQAPKGIPGRAGRG